MANFQNTKKLWKYIHDRESNKVINEDLNSTYKESFTKDLERSNGELHINGESIDSILERARKRIKFPDNDTQQEIPIELTAHIIFDALFEEQPGKKATKDIDPSLAADFIFNQLSKKQHSKEASEAIDPAIPADLFSEGFAKKPTRKSGQEQCFEKFLRIYLHQGFIFPNIDILSTLSERYRFASPEKRTINLIYTDDGLSIQVNFVTQKITDLSSSEILETTGEDFFIKGAATYKVNIKPFDKEGWIAQFGLIESKLECKDEFKDMDTRNILEKFQEFLNTILDKLKNYFSSENSLSSSQINHGSFFCISEDGRSVSGQVVYKETDKTEQSSVLEITLNGMTR